MAAFGPALANGALLMISVMWLVASPHGALPYAVSVKVTLPLLISAGLGEYVGCKALALSNIPEPELTQLKLV